MKVSVVIPLYNKAAYIARAVASVAAQTHRDLELIVVDDGSTDGGADIVRAYDDPRVRLISQPNAGVSAARNRGVVEARSDWVAFLDADDEWLPEFLQTVIDLRARYPDAGMYATAVLFSWDGRTHQGDYVGIPDAPEGGLLPDYFRAGLGTPPVCSSAVMTPKNTLAEVGGFPVGMTRGEDLSTWARIALRYRVAWSPVPGAIYHLSAQGRACSRATDKAEVACAPVIEQFLESGAEPVSSRFYMREYLARQRLSMAMDLYLRGNRARASDLLKKTRCTIVFRRRRLLLRLIFLFPPRVLRTLLRVTSKSHRVLAGNQ
jgi:glycosyltransferase involved in cell wall biosynthesis